MRVCRWFAIFLLVLPAAAPAQKLPSERKASEFVIEATIPVRGDFMAFGFGALWLTSGTSVMTSGTSVARIDPADHSVTEIAIEGAQGGFRAPAAGEGALWVASVAADRIYRIDPTTNAVTLTLPADMYDSEGSIVVGEGSVWAVTAGEKPDSILTRFDATSGTPTARITLPAPGTGVALDGGAVWVTSPYAGKLFRIDPATDSVVATVPIGGFPRFLTAGEGALWILDQRGSIRRVDPASGALTATIPLRLSGSPGGDIAVGGGFVWVSAWGAPVMQIDPMTDRLLARYVGGAQFGDALRYGAGSLWIPGPTLFRIRPPEAP